MPTYSNTFSLSGWDEMNQLLQQRQQEANVGRIPGAAGLEAQSSDIIAQLLNPPTQFTDVDRQAAELGAARGVGGSAAATSTGYRMTDEERLKRMALGQQMLTSAYARNPAADLLNPVQFTVTPYQQAQLDLLQQRQDLAEEQWKWRVNRLNQPSFTYSGGAPTMAPSRPSGGNRLTADMLTPDILRQLQTTGTYTPDIPTEDLISGWVPTEGGYSGTDLYDPTGGYLPLYPGGTPVGGDIYDFQATDPFGEEDYFSDPFGGEDYFSEFYM